MATLLCFPTILKRDTETGCVLMSSCNNNNTTTQYEECRQSFYLKQQNEILKQNFQQQQDVTPANKYLQGITYEQSQKISQLTQDSELANYKIQNLNLMNGILIAILIGIVCIFIAIKFVNRKVM